MTNGCGNWDQGVCNRSWRTKGVTLELGSGQSCVNGEGGEHGWKAVCQHRLEGGCQGFRGSEGYVGYSSPCSRTSVTASPAVLFKIGKLTERTESSYHHLQHWHCQYWQWTQRKIHKCGHSQYPSKNETKVIYTCIHMCIKVTHWKWKMRPTDHAI